MAGGGRGRGVDYICRWLVAGAEWMPSWMPSQWVWWMWMPSSPAAVGLGLGVVGGVMAVVLVGLCGCHSHSGRVIRGPYGRLFAPEGAPSSSSVVCLLACGQAMHEWQQLLAPDVLLRQSCHDQAGIPSLLFLRPQLCVHGGRCVPDVSRCVKGLITCHSCFLVVCSGGKCVADMSRCVKGLTACPTAASWSAPTSQVGRRTADGWWCGAAGSQWLIVRCLACTLRWPGPCSQCGAQPPAVPLAAVFVCSSACPLLPFTPGRGRP